MNKQVEQIRNYIEQQKANNLRCKGSISMGQACEDEFILRFIDSLPDEQPEDFNDAFDKYMKEEWSHGTQLNDIARHFYELGKAKQMPDEQPSKSLDADIEMEWDSFNKHLAEYGDESDEVVWLNSNSFNDVARHFYELGKNSK